MYVWCRLTLDVVLNTRVVLSQVIGNHGNIVKANVPLVSTGMHRDAMGPSRHRLESPCHSAAARPEFALLGGEK